MISKNPRAPSLRNVLINYHSPEGSKKRGIHIWRPIFFGFFTPSPLVMYRIQLILFLSSLLFGDPSPPSQCGRHIWKPPKALVRARFPKVFTRIEEGTDDDKRRRGGWLICRCHFSKLLCLDLSAIFAAILTIKSCKWSSADFASNHCKSTKFKLTVLRQ